MLTFGSFFSGIGLLDYGLHLAGIEHAWFCEVDPWRREILKRRWPGRPVYDDIRNVGADTAVRVDGIVGGFPCKGASTAGKRTGFDHPETVLWREMARAVRELRPRYVVVENVANILALHDGAVWGEVLGDLAALGFDVEWDCLPAGAVGAPHLRDRVFAIAAHPDRKLRQARGADAREERAGRSSSGGGVGAAPDADLARADAHTAAGGSRPAARERDRPAPHAGSDGVRQQPEPEPGSGRETVAGRAGAAPADPARDAERGAGEATGADRERTRPRAGVNVEWGEYEPAIRRWEAVHGPAPEPLVRRMDARDAARVERSRLSALGDGVQVQVGYLTGRHVVGLEEGRLAA